MNRLVESIQKNHSLNNTTKRIKLNILQYIIDNIPTIPILPDLLFHIQNFKFNNIHHLNDLDHRYLLQSTNIINNKVITILNSNSINNNRLNPNNIGILSNKMSKRKYAKIQNMFTKNRSGLSRAIFDNDDITDECDEVPIENQFKFWSELFNKTSIPFSRTFTNNTLYNTTPISLGEVQACFIALHDGAPGIDNIKKNDLTKIGLKNLTARFNVYLLTSNAPSVFKSGLTSLIPKCKHTRDPSKCRPITMSSLINRLFHNILAKRIENTIVLDPRQKAFIRRDGIAENISLLKNIIYQDKQKLRPLKICLFDVSKTFDSVSNDAIICIANRAGLPKTIIETITYAYTNCNTQLKYKKGISPSILVNRGVKQGDPMLPILFNAVIDYVTYDLPSYISIHNNSIVKYM